MRHRIMGVDVQLDISDPGLRNILKEELRGYEEMATQPLGVVIISDVIDESISPHAKNPAIHSYSGNGFIGDFGAIKVQWIYSSLGVKRINFQFSQSTGKVAWLKKRLTKFRSMQYQTPIEAAGQFLHELIFVPLAFQQERNFPLHSAGLLTPSGTALLIGGTGGVGKTSSLLKLGRLPEWKFIADDIIIGNADGTVFPNLAYPKIYAYNLPGNAEITDIVMKDRGVFDRFQWYLKGKIHGQSSVRRRISPSALFDITKGSVRAGAYIILARGNTKNFKLKPIASSEAVAASLAVMKTEYEVFFRHLTWAQFNSVMFGGEVLPTAEDLIEKWKMQMHQALAKLPCFFLEIPIEANHEDLLRNVSKLLFEVAELDGSKAESH